MTGLPVAAQVDSDQEQIFLPDENGMLSYEAFMLPQPDYTVEVMVIRNLNTAYNRREDWSEAKLKAVIQPDESVDGSIADDLIDESEIDPRVAEESETEIPDVTDVDLRDCPVLIERALMLESNAPQRCLSAVVRFIPTDATMLADAIRTLELSSDYAPLAMLAWSQPGYPRDDSPVFELRPLGIVSDAIQGTVSLSRGRYLHLELDLEFLPGLDASTPVVSSVSDDSGPSGHPDDPGDLDYAGVYGEPGEAGPPAAPQSYHLRESRRMKRDEVHYFDHPMFAVLAIVTRYEVPDDNGPGDDSDGDSDIGDVASTADN